MSNRNRKPSALTKSQIDTIVSAMNERGMKKMFVAEKLGLSPEAFTACIKGNKNVFEPKRAILRDLLNIDFRSLPKALDSYSEIWNL